MPKVLVTDAGSRNTVAVVRSLGRAGLDVITAEVSRVAMCRFSKFVKGHRVYPRPSESPEIWVEWLLREVAGGDYSMVLPMDDDTVRICSMHKDRISRFTRLPVPDFERFSKAEDKYETLQLASRVGIPAPKTILPTEKSGVKALASNMKFPVVVKPRSSSGSRGIVYVRNIGELESSFQAVHAKYPWPLVQECIPPGGEACGVFALFNRQHRPVATFCHRRLRSYPVNGGPSTLRESISAPELVSQGVRLLEEMSWYGVAMVEFLQDPRDGTHKLMEVNPRFWGSLQLSISSGVDFPLLLYRVAMDEKLEGLSRYELGVRCRWLLPGDILHFISNPNRLKMKPSFFSFDSKTSDDFLSWRDPGPTLGFFLMVLRYAFAKQKWRYVFKR